MEQMREQTRRQWRARARAPGGLWVFAYGSLIWRPEFDYAERRPARVHGWHRALAMWSEINRGSPEVPGLVFAMLPGGSCRGVAFRMPDAGFDAIFDPLWEREMPDPVYDPHWLRCSTPEGPVRALAFTLSRRSPAFTGRLSPQQYRHIFRHARGRYGSTLDYAQDTLDSLRANGIRDPKLAALLEYAHDA